MRIAIHIAWLAGGFPTSTPNSSNLRRCRSRRRHCCQSSWLARWCRRHESQGDTLPQALCRSNHLIGDGPRCIGNLAQGHVQEPIWIACSLRACLRTSSSSISIGWRLGACSMRSFHARTSSSVGRTSFARLAWPRP